MALPSPPHPNLPSSTGEDSGGGKPCRYSSPPSPSPVEGADRGRYVMRATFEPLPSPIKGEGSGGGEDRTASPHPHLPPPRGKG
jgi:hypothetical protein